MLNSSRQAMDYQFKLNQQLAEENRNWQERMANSAHQRQIADLKAAGLNPVLSVTGGSGANTPSGSTASVSDGAGYFSALANLEATKINSATQYLMHTTPSASSPFGMLEYGLNLLGSDTAEVLGKVADGVVELFKNITPMSDREDRILTRMATLELDMLNAELSGNKKDYRIAKRRYNNYRQWHPKMYDKYVSYKNKHK